MENPYQIDTLISPLGNKKGTGCPLGQQIFYIPLAIWAGGGERNAQYKRINGKNSVNGNYEAGQIQIYCFSPTNIRTVTLKFGVYRDVAIDT